jgi:hypothetical protein
MDTEAPLNAWLTGDPYTVHVLPDAVVNSKESYSK